jgi:hypothetical protein
MSNLMRAPESPSLLLGQVSGLAAASAVRVVSEVRDHRQELVILGGTLGFVVLVGLLSLVALVG